ncbi:histidine phosphatase family protein [Rhodohalobacter barkolensis]|uniref:Histidine phosphatase family protein n=1 Tax=Rhodohalobacter barkolensis TaxID=2053187 RepID=A0A2N0VLW9_9BACT|nr:histidine phosphatase family protein [Rhodohalobacter barkolensis]
MSVKRLLIARHGETDYNQKGLLQGRSIDAPLNETGWIQAGKLSDYLTNYPADHLYSSSLQRTWQTAKPYSQKLKLETLQEKGLDEMDFGKYEGIPYLDASADLKELQEIWQSGDVNTPIPGGESPVEVFERANSVFHQVIESTREDTLVFILHGRLIRILLSKWLGYGLKNMHKIEHQNGAINHLVYDGEFRAVYLNKTDHLK